MKTFGLSWPVCGKCCEVALFPWLGGPHHCVVKYPEESIADWPLTVAELLQETDPYQAALQQLSERLARAVEGVAHAGGSRIDATLDPDGTLELRSDRSDGPEQILSADEALRLLDRAGQVVDPEMPVGALLMYKVASILRELAFLNPRLTITVSDGRWLWTLHYPRGLLDHIRYINRIWTPIHDDVLHFRDVVNDATIEVAAQWNPRYSADFHAFINGVRMPWWSGYETGCTEAIADVLNEYVIQRGWDSGDPLEGSIVGEGLVLVCSLRSAAPRSAVDRLMWLREINPYLARIVARRFKDWFDEHPEIAAAVIAKAIESRDESLGEWRVSCRA